MPDALAPAKINLFLHVGPRRADGYHPVCSLMEKVSIFDLLSLEPDPGGRLRVEGEGLPPGKNIIEKAAEELSKELGRGIGARVFLRKQIPVAAGLAGGSSDAAAALKLLAATPGQNLDPTGLMRVAAAVGADVPFFLRPGAQLAQGIGERLSAVDLDIKYTVVIVAPQAELATADVYHKYDLVSEGLTSFEEQNRRARRALAAADSLESLVRLLHNDLEPAAMSLCPLISPIKEELTRLGAAGVLMSGSGPAVFGLFAGKKPAEAAAARLARTGPRVWVAEPVRR